MSCVNPPTAKKQVLIDRIRPYLGKLMTAYGDKALYKCRDEASIRVPSGEIVVLVGFRDATMQDLEMFSGRVANLKTGVTSLEDFVVLDFLYGETLASFPVHVDWWPECVLTAGLKLAVAK